MNYTAFALILCYVETTFSKLLDYTSAGIS